MSKLGDMASSLSEQLPESVMQQVSQEVSETLSEAASGDWGPTVEKLVTAGKECEQSARATIDVCNATNDKREKMIAFGRDIEATLQGMKKGGGAHASILETIKQMTDGNKIQAAKELAKGLDTAALDCVEKSVHMIGMIEDGMDSLPPVVHNAIDRFAASQPDVTAKERSVNDLLTGMETEVQDIKKCVAAIENLNLATALKVGAHAFTQLTTSSKQAHVLFETIKEFAGDVQNVSRGITDFSISELTAKAKDLLEILRLTACMRKVSEGAGKLVKTIIHLFEVTSQRISTLWSALAFAKKCLEDSLSHILDARKFCTDACDKSINLIEKSTTVTQRLHSVQQIDAEAMNAVRELVQGNDIQDAIQLSQNMTELVLNCSEKVTNMVDRVTEGFHKIPPILTKGIDMKQAGREDRDPDPANVENDITELQEATRDIESSNLLGAVQAGAKGFTGVSNKASVCKDMLQKVEGFAGGCQKNIDSFMNVWDLDAATTKITEMCRLVSLGEMMKQFAEQIKQLIEAIIALLSAALKKFSSGVGEAVHEMVGGAMDLMKNKLHLFG